MHCLLGSTKKRSLRDQHIKVGIVLHATKVLKSRTFNVVISFLALTTVEQYQLFVINRSVSPLPYKLGSPYLVHTSMMKDTCAYLFAFYYPVAWYFLKVTQGTNKTEWKVSDTGSAHWTACTISVFYIDMYSLSLSIELIIIINSLFIEGYTVT